MIDNLLVISPWFALAAGLAIYTLDILLTVYERYLYYSGAKEIVEIHDRYELRRPFQQAGGLRQFWDRRYTLYLLGVAVTIPFTWWVFVRQNNLPQVFVFASGGLVLYEIAECVRLARSATLFRHARDKRGLQGRVEVAGWVTTNLYVIDLYGFALVYLLAFLVSGSMFFLGGVATCFIFGHQVRDYTSVRKVFDKRR